MTPSTKAKQLGAKSLKSVADVFASIIETSAMVGDVINEDGVKYETE